MANTLFISQCSEKWKHQEKKHLNLIGTRCHSIGTTGWRIRKIDSGPLGISSPESMSCILPQKPLQDVPNLSKGPYLWHPLLQPQCRPCSSESWDGSSYRFHRQPGHRGSCPWYCMAASKSWKKAAFQIEKTYQNRVNEGFFLMLALQHFRDPANLWQETNVLYF